MPQDRSAPPPGYEVGPDEDGWGWEMETTSENWSNPAPLPDYASALAAAWRHYDARRAKREAPPRILHMSGESGETFTIYVHGHVTAEDYRRIYASELDREPPDADEIVHSWGRWVPVPKGSPDRAAFSRMLYSAKPGARGAFPYTENTRDEP